MFGENQRFCNDMKQNQQLPKSYDNIWNTCQKWLNLQAKTESCWIYHKNWKRNTWRWKTNALVSKYRKCTQNFNSFSLSNLSSVW